MERHGLKEMGVADIKLQWHPPKKQLATCVEKL
jgi:hypothetical protein